MNSVNFHLLTVFCQCSWNEEFHCTETLCDELQLLLAVDACMSFVQVLKDARCQGMDVWGGYFTISVAEDRFQSLNALYTYLKNKQKANMIIYYSLEVLD